MSCKHKTLEDYAMAALSGRVANDYCVNEDPESLANWAFQVAKAMKKEEKRVKLEENNNEIKTKTV